jgi:hypothetical protein
MNKIFRRSQLTPYESDYSQWCTEQGALLREGRLAELDRENLAEEIESLGRSDRKEIRKRLRVLLQHLLKWKYQPSKRKHGWNATILIQRQELRRVLAESPNLKEYPQKIVSEVYEAARLKAADETGLGLETFPGQCPFSVEQTLSLSFLPGEG